MVFISELRSRVEGLASRAPLDVDPSSLPAVVAALDDDRLLDVLADAASLANAIERLRVVAAGVAAARSTRDRGHRGLAATQGHRTPAALVQSIAGGTKADAERHVRLGTALLESAIPGLAGSDPVEADGVAGNDAPSATSSEEPLGVVTPEPWDASLCRALLAGRLTAPQHDAIRRGLGDPPTPAMGTTDAVAVVWGIAAEQLRAEAQAFTAEELLRRARQVRDSLDPVGAEERFERRFERRSFRVWMDADGTQHASIAFDDEMAAWVHSIVDAALRPRRGGPRFIDADEAAAAERLVADGRSNDQLTYDLMMDLLRAGAVASTDQVFGSRQPGVRLVSVQDAVGPRDALGRLVATAHLEDRGDAVPGSILDRALCTVGSVNVSVDGCGNPLNVGREQRLFTPRQRIALAVRDGGCLFPGCTVPASYCESHHIDHWERDHGCTDIDRGVLLCRFHHMTLHANGWSIRRRGKDAFMLHAPPGSDAPPIELRSRSPLRWAWDPPPVDRRGWRAA